MSLHQRSSEQVLCSAVVENIHDYSEFRDIFCDTNRVSNALGPGPSLRLVDGPTGHLNSRRIYLLLCLILLTRLCRRISTSEVPNLRVPRYPATT